MDLQMSSALSLLGIGMITVFIVLLLVVLTGNLLISLVNALAKENDQINNDGLADEEMAVIQAAVEVVTHGKGRITQIEKR